MSSIQFSDNLGHIGVELPRQILKVYYHLYTEQVGSMSQQLGSKGKAKQTSQLHGMSHSDVGSFILTKQIV